MKILYLILEKKNIAKNNYQTTLYKHIKTYKNNFWNSIIPELKKKKSKRFMKD